MSENLKLGQIITTPQQRDAIHIAVVPVVAAVSMQPGTRCGIDPLGKAAPCIESTGSYVGVVGPFLREAVPTGARFWLFLEPGSITSLRHDWTHPAFEAAPSPPAPADEKAASEAWLRDFINRSDCPDYWTVIGAAVSGTGAWDDEYMHFDGQDAHGEIPPEFWHHVEVVTGEKITLRPKYFSCSC